MVPHSAERLGHGWGRHGAPEGQKGRGAGRPRQRSAAGTLGAGAGGAERAGRLQHVRLRQRHGQDGLRNTNRVLLHRAGRVHRRPVQNRLPASLALLLMLVVPLASASSVVRSLGRMARRVCAQPHGTCLGLPAAPTEVHLRPRCSPAELIGNPSNPPQPPCSISCGAARAAPCGHHQAERRPCTRPWKGATGSARAPRARWLSNRVLPCSAGGRVLRLVHTHATRRGPSSCT